MDPCANCRRRGDDIFVHEISKVDLNHKQGKVYWNIGRIPRHQESVWLCRDCRQYLLEGSNDGCDYWPSMIYKFLVHAGPEDCIQPLLREKWEMIPESWRHWWLDEFSWQDSSIDDGSEALFVDMTEELKEVEGAISELTWLRLAKAMDRHFAYPEIRCPWGCSEFLHKANKLPMKDFLWYISNYQMKCLDAPKGKHWSDYISPSYPSRCLILDKFVCAPSLVMTEDGPMILCCRNHTTKSINAFVHVPESPTGTIYTPNSNAFAPVTLRSRTNRSFKPSTFSDTWCSVRQVGGFGGIDSAYATSSNMASRSDSLSLMRDSLCLQGRPDIRAQFCDRSTDPKNHSYVSSESVQNVLRFAESKYPSPSELKENRTSSYVSCESAVRLQEQMYGEGSATLKVYYSENQYDLKLFNPPWPTHFVEVHPTDGYGQRFRRVMETDLGLWMLLCVSGSVTDVWECLAKSVVDNKSWVGHWLNYASSFLRLSGKRRSDHRIFPSHNKNEMIDEISVLTNGMSLGDALGNDVVASNLFASCGDIFVVDGYFSETVYTDEEISKWNVVICVNPEYHHIDACSSNQFELRCLINVDSEDTGRKNRNMYVRHGGQNFWVQRGTNFPTKCDGGSLGEIAWENGKIAVFCRKRQADVNSLRRRYLNVIGGQSHVFCQDHKCPMILNYANIRDSSSAVCVCGRGNLDYSAGGMNETDRCQKHAAYMCPQFSDCGSAVCSQHLDESRAICDGIGPDATMYLSMMQCRVSRAAGDDDGAFIAETSSLMAGVSPAALGPTAAHELPQDIIYDDGGHCDDDSDDGSNCGSLQDVLDENSVDDAHGGDIRNENNDIGDCPDASFGLHVLNAEMDAVFAREFNHQYRDVGANDADVMVNDEQHDGSALVDEINMDVDHFATQGLPMTTAGTDQRELETEHFDASGYNIPLCVLMNQLGHLLTRTGHKIRMNKKHRHLCERLVATNESKVIPLVYAEGQLFGDIFWQSLEDGSIPGAMPAALWTDKQTLSRLGIASMREHAKQRLTNPALLTSVDPNYHFMLLDQLSNLGACGKHTRLVLQRGFADHQGKDGVTFREKSDSAEIYGESCENHANVHKLSALVRERRPHFFFTQTCNQQTCRGLRVLREWVESDEAKYRLHEKYSLEFNEASRFLRESAATYASRSWNEVIDMWMRYIIYSPEQPLGPIDYAWYRKEFQDTQGNLSHIHAILRLLIDVNNPEGLQFVLNKIRGCLRELISHDEYEDMLEKGLITSAAHLYDILDKAKMFLTHKCHLRCQIPKTTDDGETFFICKVKENYFRTMTPQVHTIAPVPISHIGEAKRIYNRLGMMVGDKVIEECLIAEFHVPVSSREDSKFSPTNPLLFVLFPSSQNLQFTTGHTISSYLVKYVTKLDDVARVIIKPPGRNDNSGAKAVIEQLHNTKITSNKIRADETRNKDLDYGRLINHTECISVLLADQIVTSTVAFIYYSTSPREYRPAFVKRSQPKTMELLDYIANISVLGQEVRRAKLFPVPRQFSSHQLTVIFDEKSSSLTSDVITEFSIRPPELRFVNMVPLYTRWFEKVPIEMKEKTLENVRKDLEKRLDRDITKCEWVNGLNSRVVLRRGAVDEIIEYAQGCDEMLFGNRRLKANMMALLLQIQRALHPQQNRSIRRLTLQSSASQHAETIARFLSVETSASLPVPWTTPVFPKNRGRFLIHILLMFGGFETEYGLMAHSTMKDAFVHAGLFDPDNAEESVDMLIKRYVRECLCFQSGSVYLHDRNLVLAQSAFFDCLLGIDSDAVMGTPCVLQTAMQEETSEKIHNHKCTLLSAFIGALYGDLTKSGFSMAQLPPRAPLESMHLSWQGLQHHGTSQYSAGVVEYEFPPSYNMAGLQSEVSYTEQKGVLVLAKKTINRYLSGYSHKNVVVCGGPGNGKTTVCEEICLYALANGLKGISTSIVADRSKALGGMHVHLLCGIQASDRCNMSPGQAAEAAVANMYRKPEMLHFWRELQFLYIDEFGAVSSEMLATMDIIARHLKDSSRFLGGMLAICSMDVFQLLPIDGTALMLSMNMMTEFSFSELSESVRAATDPDLRRLCNLTRNRVWTDDTREEFSRIITEKCSFLSSFEDPNTPDDGIYVFARKPPCEKIEDMLIRNMQQDNNTCLVLSKAEDEESTIAGNWRPATVPVSRELSRKQKLKADLYLFENGRYEFTYNHPGRFQQGQLAILLTINQDDVDSHRDLEFFKGPPGCKEFPLLHSCTREFLVRNGWETVMVPYETSKPKRIRSRLVG